MSNLYLSQHMSLDIETCSQRMRRLYNAWMNADDSPENNALLNVDCFVVLVGNDDSKSISFHKWLFGYGSNNTICVFTRDTVCILGTKKETEFIKPVANYVGQRIQLFVHDQTDNDIGNFTKLLNLLKLSRNGKKIGVFNDDCSTDQFCESWKMAMAAYDFETINMDTSLAYIMAVKDESEVAAIQGACLVSTNVFQSYLKPHILEIIKAKQDVKHSQLAEGVELALSNKKIIPDTVDTTQLKLCYPPIIQSGGNYCLDYNVGSDQNRLQSGPIVCSLGVRYKSYCSNISRTLLFVERTNIMQMNYNFMQSLEKELLKNLVPGAKLCDIYHSGLEFTKKVRIDLVGHLAGTFGSAIGIEFCDSSLVIGPQCTAIVKSNMVFNMCVSLTGLTHSDDASDTYALSHSDTAIVNSSSDPAAILTSTDAPPYLKLIVDCWEHIIDFLSFEDLLSMGRTCKPLNHLVGYYLRENFGHFVVSYSETIAHFCIGKQPVDVPSIFWQFIKKLMILKDINFNLNAKAFPSLKTLCIGNQAETSFHRIGNVLMNIETILLWDCDIIEILDQIAKFCPKLKSLIMTSRQISGAATNIFSKSYPALEHLMFDYNQNVRIEELKLFLEKHPKLKHFEIDAYAVWANRDILAETNIQLNVLTIILHLENNTILPIIQLVNSIKTLYERGLYKTLYLKCFGFTVRNIDIFTLNSISATLASINIKRLEVVLSEVTADKIECLAINMQKLESLVVSNTTFDQILPFVRHLKRLKSITITYLKNSFFDSFALNAERKKLGNAAHITLQLPEDAYLSEMWKSKNFNLEHVKIVRFKSEY